MTTWSPATEPLPNQAPIAPSPPDFSPPVHSLIEKCFAFAMRQPSGSMSALSKASVVRPQVSARWNPDRHSPLAININFRPSLGALRCTAKFAKSLRNFTMNV